MTEKRFQKRYIKKNKKVYDTWKKMPITDELNSDSLLNVLSHLNGLGELIDIKIEQGRYCVKRYMELKEENEQLKFQLQNTSDQRDEFHRGARENANRVGKLKKENERLKQQISDLRKENYGNIDGIGFYQEENASLGERIADLEELNRIYVDFLVEKGYELSDVMK